MSDLMTKFFGPLDKSSCSYFLIICGIFLFILVITLFTEIFFFIKYANKFNFKYISHGILILFNIFLGYFVNRLLYTMCTKSLA